MTLDYTPIAELPGGGLSAEQFRRLTHRYWLACELAAGQRVLEVSCGAGSGLGLLAQNARQLVAMDSSQPLLELAHSHYGGRVALARADAQALPFGSNRFDLLLCLEALYYLPDYRRFLCESRRLLSAAGTLLISLSNPDWPYFVPGPLSSRYPPLPELTESLAEAGFTTIQAFGILPADSQGPTQRLRSRARQLLLQTPPLARLLRQADCLTAPLKRAVYGCLLPLPPELHAYESAQGAAGTTLYALPLHQIDRVHQVLYLLATAQNVASAPWPGAEQTAIGSSMPTQTPPASQVHNHY